MRESSADLILAWIRERYPLRIFAPLAVLLAAAGVATSDGSAASLFAVARSAALALILVLAFRLWDDLEDAEHDRLDHPYRVLPNATRRAPFLLVLGVVSLCSMAGLRSLPVPAVRLTAAVVGAGMLLLWYRGRRLARADATLNAHVVLLKYPLIAWLVAPGAHDREWITVLPALAVVYLALCVHEALHDARIRRAPGVHRVVAVECALLCLVAAHALLAAIPGGTAP